MNSLLLRLTKLHIHRIKGEYVRIQLTKILDGTEREVIVFAGEQSIFLGQCTLYRTIIINESVINNERFLNYVLIHEIEHSKQWWAIFIIPLLFLIILGFFLLISSLIYLIQFISSMDTCYLVWSIGMFVTALLSISIPCCYSWIMEIHADFAAIRYLGVQEFLNIKIELHKSYKRGLEARIINRLTHPTTGFTIYVWRLLHR